MTPEQFEQRWGEVSREVIVGMKEWRLQHPHATLKEIEQATDERLGRLRARMVEDSAQSSTLREFADLPAQERPRCPQCGGVLQARGRQGRTLQTHQGQELRLERQYGVCIGCGAGLFPPG